MFHKMNMHTYSTSADAIRNGRIEAKVLVMVVTKSTMSMEVATMLSMMVVTLHQEMKSVYASLCRVFTSSS